MPDVSPLTLQIFQGYLEYCSYLSIADGGNVWDANARIGSCVAVKTLPLNTDVEIECIAVL